MQCNGGCVIFSTYNICTAPHVRCLFTEVDPGLVGLALTYTVAIASIFQWCIQQSAEVETIVSGNPFISHELDV